MTGIEMVFAGPLGKAIGWALVHLLWQGVLVAAILAATLALLQRQNANARYLASCGALILLVALGIATGYRAYDPAAAPVMPAAVAAYIQDSSSDAAVVEQQAQSADSTPAPASTTWQDLFVSAVTIANAHLAQIVAIWLAGVVILSTRLIIGWIGAHRLTTRRSHAASSQWIRSLNRISESLRLRRSITLLESAAVEVPTVIGWLRPVVLLPVASLSGLSMQQIEMILAHELAHIRRHDFIVNLMQSVVETLLFYHPAVWWISGRIRIEREHCCDDLAVAVFGDPVQYARALTRFEELRLDEQSVLAANGGSLIARIRRLVIARAESASWSSRWAAGAALITVVAVMLIAPALPLFANRDEQTPKPAPAPAPAPAAQPAPDKMKVKDKDCDKTKECDKSDATVEVEAADDMTDESDDPSSDDENSDEPPMTPMTPMTPIAPMAPMAPMALVRPVVVPRVAVHVAPMAAIDIDRITAEALQQVEVTPTPDGQRVRHKIGEGGRLSVDDLIALRTAGVDPKYIEEMRSSGIGDLTLDDLVAMRIQGVTPTYIKEMASAGYSKLTAHELISMRIQGVTPKYVGDLASAGYKNLAAHDLISMRMQGVNSEFVKSLADAGYTNLSPKELIRLRVSGVDADFIRELSKYRTK
jgi:beta-lactamase regulating signal transducer with metallopeptidase domain